MIRALSWIQIALLQTSRAWCFLEHNGVNCVGGFSYTGESSLNFFNLIACEPPAGRAFFPMMSWERASGKRLCSLFSSPGFRNSCIKHDWLHCVDLGVGADFLGGTFQYLVDSYFEGPSKKARCLALFKEIQKYYKETNAASRLPTLTPGMLTKENKKSNKKSWPKLRAKAGEARALISFCRQAVHKYCLKDTEFESRLRQAATSLEACYALLSVSQWTLAKMQTTARKFAFYFLALTNCEGQKWFRAKPKEHAFLECSRSPVPPSRTWSYRDESFGHTMSQLATRRGGGAHSACSQQSCFAQVCC